MPIKLADETISQPELESLCEWILAGNRLTKDYQTVEFENEFRVKLGAKHAIYTNSGSSSNLLMISALLEGGYLRNRKVVAPAISWVTTVSPLLQLGFDVSLCDCDNKNLGLNIGHLETLCAEHKPALMFLVHVLGHVNNLAAIKDICDRHDVILIEDSCEALGSRYRGKALGACSTAGSFSFYYGHQLSTIEGGMVVTDDSNLHQIMLSLRSHGWSRDLSAERREALTSEYDIDEFANLYTFYYPGYNMRSTDLQAFIGRSQLKRLDDLVEIRQNNFREYARQLPDYFIQESETTPLSSFSYGTLVKNRLEVFNHLRAREIECRPLICGNIGRHPFWTKRHGQVRLRNADILHEFGMYLPNHGGLTQDDIDFVCHEFRKVADPCFF